MKTRIEFRYLFLAIGGRVSHEWHVQADYEYTEHPTFDLEGDRANMPDVEEYLKALRVNDFTTGFDAGEIDLTELPDTHYYEIVKIGLRAGRHEYEQRKRNYIAQGGSVQSGNPFAD